MRGLSIFNYNLKVNKQAWGSPVIIVSNPKQPSCKTSVRPQKGHSEKRCEIQGGGQEMAVMVG